MSSTVTFKTKDNKFELTVKKEFVDSCPDYLNLPASELNAKFFMWTFLHNEHGPAIVKFGESSPKQEIENYKHIFHEGNRIEFWLNGECVNHILHKATDFQKVETLMHNYLFKTKLESELNE